MSKSSLREPNLVPFFVLCTLFGALNCFSLWNSIYLFVTRKRDCYDTDCTYDSQWGSLLPFYSCREDGVEFPDQWESRREVHSFLSDRYQYFRWGDTGRSECCQIRKMKVILDTNIWISFLLGKRLTILREIIEMEEVEIYVSDALLSNSETLLSGQNFLAK